MNLDSVGPGYNVPTGFNVPNTIPSQVKSVQDDTDNKSGTGFASHQMTPLQHMPGISASIPCTLTEEALRDRQSAKQRGFQSPGVI